MEGEEAKVLAYQLDTEVNSKEDSKNRYLSALLAIEACDGKEKTVLESYFHNANIHGNFHQMAEPGHIDKEPGDPSITLEKIPTKTWKDLNNEVLGQIRKHQADTARLRKEPTSKIDNEPCEYILKLLEKLESTKQANLQETMEGAEFRSIYTKYKTVAQKTRPVIGDLPSGMRIERNIIGDPLAGMTDLPTNPPDFEPTGRYTQERMEAMDKKHKDFLWPEELKLLHYLMMMHNLGFAWDPSERGEFKSEFFPDVNIPIVEGAKPWVLKPIPIAPGLMTEVCKLVKEKMNAGVYEPSNSSYRTRWFTVLKPNGSRRIVHSLEPLNAVTIQHSGLPPATEVLAEHFAGRSVTALLDLFVGFDNRNIAESSRDYTTFQTPYGPMRLVKLPMGWTNSVPIFHDDVNHILQPEVPHNTIPYIDDVPIRGSASRYELDDGGYETIPENPGIRRFIWDHFQVVQRIVQRMWYSGGTFSGTKSCLASGDQEIVGHRCTYEGRKPSENRIKVLEQWGPCKDVPELRSFVGTCNVMRMFIKDYSKIAEPLQKLMRKDAEYVWGEEQEIAQRELVAAIKDCPALRPIRYEWDSEVVLAVDTSWKAVGFYIYQCDPVTPKLRYYARFGSITMEERQARFSQPKRELFGLKVALQHCENWLLGSRKLVVETDAKFLKGMLDNAGKGPNATINRWIEEILMFHFKLRHVRGATFPVDGLSRKAPSAGDIPMPARENEFIDHGPLRFENTENGDPEMEDFVSFKSIIDTRGGYYQHLATHYTDIETDARIARENDREWVEEQRRLAEDGTYHVFAAGVIEDLERYYDPKIVEPYPLDHRTKVGIEQDDRLPKLKIWLKDPTSVYSRNSSEKDLLAFRRWGKYFFLDKEGRLYRRGQDGKHMLVVDRDHRMYMMRAAHDSIGHRGFFATKDLLQARFWWPELERDVSWYVKTCHLCQIRQKELIRIPPNVSFTPSLFQHIHVDTFLMPISNGCRYVLAGRCGLSVYAEARAVAKESTKSIAMWIFEDFICRWGCPKTIQTDNAPQFKAAARYLEDKYGIKGIQISAYNHRAAGKVERSHWDMRQMLFKSTGGNPTKWFWFLHHVLWADRVTIRKGLGCSPFFIVTGSHPVLPIDVEEATWMVKPPSGPMTDEELIAHRARVLSKHPMFLERVKKHVTLIKQKDALRYEEMHKHVIKDYDFKPGDLVLIRNSRVEMELNRKFKPRQLGPMVVIRRSKGGSYIIADMNGAVFQNRIAQFRVTPYYAREKIDLPEKLQDFIDMTDADLAELAAADITEEEIKEGKDLFWEGVKLKNDLDIEELMPESDWEDQEQDNDGEEEDIPQDKDPESDDEEDAQPITLRRSTRKRF